MQLSIVWLAVTASLFSSFAVAQTDNDEMERVVVTATRTQQPWLNTPASINRVEVKQQLPGLRVDAAELLQGIPGVQADTRYNFAQDTRITLRGFGARAAFGVRGVLLRLDGIPLSMPDGQAQTSSILLDEATRVEVLRGPIAGVYGNASGGIIDLQSERPQTSTVAFGHAVGANSRERSTLDATYQGDQAGASIHHARFRTEGDRDHARAERDQWAARGYYEWNNGLELIARVDDNKAPLLQDPGSLTPEQWRQDPDQTFAGAAVFNTRKRIHHKQQSVTLRQRQTAQSWQIAAWHGDREIEQYLPFPGAAETSSGAVIDLARAFHGVHAQYSLLPEIMDGTLELSLGIDLERQQDTRLGFVNNGGNKGELRRDETGTVDTDDIYALANWRLTPQLTWLTGLRRSDISFAVADRYIVPGVVPDDSGAARYLETSWSSGLNYQLTDNWAVFGSLGEGFETPTLTELAYRNEGTGLNRTLTPATIEQFEAGLKWAAAASQAQLSLFEVRSDDEIVVDRSVDGRTTYRNAAQTRRQGIELSHQWFIDRHWQLRSSATWLTARYKGTDLDGKRIPGVANGNLFSQLNWRPWQDERLRASVSAQYRSRIAANDANDEYAPSYLLWNAALNARQLHGQWTFSQWLRVDNLLDKNYVGSVVVNQGSGRSFEPAPGRQLSAGVSIERRF